MVSKALVIGPVDIMCHWEGGAYKALVLGSVGFMCHWGRYMLNPRCLFEHPWIPYATRKAVHL